MKILKSIQFHRPPTSLIASLCEYTGMLVLAISIGAFDWRIGGVVLAIELIFVSYAIGKSETK